MFKTKKLNPEKHQVTKSQGLVRCIKAVTISEG